MVLSIEHAPYLGWIQDIDPAVRGTGAVDGVTDKVHRPMRQSRFQGGDGLGSQAMVRKRLAGPDHRLVSADASATDYAHLPPRGLL